MISERGHDVALSALVPGSTHNSRVSLSERESKQAALAGMRTHPEWRSRPIGSGECGREGHPFAARQQTEAML